MMDADSLRALLTLILFLGFVALTVFTWSKRRKSSFDELARMPLREDDDQDSETGEPR